MWSLTVFLTFQLDPEVKAAFDVAYDNIRTFHSHQQKTHTLQVETMPVGAVLLHLSVFGMVQLKSLVKK